MSVSREMQEGLPYLFYLGPFMGLIDGDTDVEEKQLFSALRCN